MNVSYHGHSVVFINTKRTKIIIDPFITGNGLTDLNADSLEVDVILLTHGHNDHVGDTVELAKRNDALVIAPFELATYLGWKGIQCHPMHIGGAHTFEFGTVKLTQAFHGSSYTEEDNQRIVYTGMPAGILLTVEGKTIFHAGDTALFSDMKLIGERNTIDLAFLPIGDNFTMGPEDATLAAEWLQAKRVVPIHYNTFPVIEQDPNEYAEHLSGKKGLALKVGEGIEL
ncbi:metal-dependent hydrolase [Halalkalibacter sp. APA_J-10(15)]|uniref:metal-dependent hydrolase n=1 Tax=unclassified Halalkalibacter TaxID=2893063 RepID=UPI001FF592BE|nr:metal-dependent hydrolase [Halalkalibacter sp. APA_J-10(15)]MCK0471330.1 metal-dependent hydrolase [Halalkalibacter sp. APA_J-10(15)]